MSDIPFKNKCPVCGSDDLEFDIIEPEGESFKQKIDCHKCGLGFTIWSEMNWVYCEECIEQDTG